MSAFVWRGPLLYWGPFAVGEVRTWGPGRGGGAAVLRRPSRDGWRRDEQAAKDAAEEAAKSIIVALIANAEPRA